jgi:hypothetical protein
MRVQSKEDSTTAINLGDNPREVENGGVEHYSDKDSSPATNLGDNPRVVENGSVEHYSDKDSSPATNSGVMPKGDCTLATNLGDNSKEVESDSVEHYSVKDSAPATSIGVISKGLSLGSKDYTEISFFVDSQGFFVYSRNSDKELLVDRKYLEEKFLKLERHFECLRKLYAKNNGIIRFVNILMVNTTF